MSKHELEAIVADIRARLERNKKWSSRFGEQSPIVLNEFKSMEELFTRILSALTSLFAETGGMCPQHGVACVCPICGSEPSAETPRGEVTDITPPIEKASLGEVVVTTTEAGECVMVSRQDAEGRILSIVWEAPKHG